MHVVTIEWSLFRFTPVIATDYCIEMCSNTGDVRLVGSVNMTEGRLEICVNDYWGTVCNDGASDVFDRNAAEVVCRQLGFPESGECFE